jgi:hypothetical protein
MLKYFAIFSAGFGCASVLFIFVIVPNYHPVHRRVYHQHFYELSEQPKFLTEELALAKARETLTLDHLVVGPDQDELHPGPDGHTRAPDVRVDEFLSRNAIGRNMFSPNRGSIMFTNFSGTRYVSVELDGRILACQTSLDK